MALLWLDGMTGYGDTDGSPFAPSGVFGWKYPSEGADWDLEVDEGRVVGDCIEFDNSVYHNHFTTPNMTTNTTMIAGIGWRTYQWALNARNDKPLLSFIDTSTRCINLAAANNTLFIEDGNGDVLGSIGVGVEKQEWHYVEMKVYCHASAGTVEVRINSCPVLTLTGVQTKFGSNAYFTRCGVGDNDDNEAMKYSRVDDFYVCDATGSTNNDFLGPVTVETLFPDGDDSVNFATTGNTANHYENVGYKHALESTDYVSDTTSGNRDLFTLDDLSSDFATIYGVIGWTATKTTANTDQYFMVCDSNGTESTSSNFAPDTSYQTDQFILEEDPDASSAWTASTINAMKFGLEIV